MKLYESIAVLILALASSLAHAKTPEVPEVSPPLVISGGPSNAESEATAISGAAAGAVAATGPVHAVGTGGNSVATGGDGGDAASTAVALGGAGGHVGRVSATGGSAEGGDALATGGHAEGGDASARGGDAASQQTTTITGDTNVYKQRRQAAGAIAIPTAPTAECIKPYAVGLSSPVGGISWSIGREQPDCRKERQIERLHARGQHEAADRLTCTLPWMREALGDDCLIILASERTSELVLRVEQAEQRAANAERVLKQNVSK